jgi:Ala-tRNA(Pro) deacylase
MGASDGRSLARWPSDVRPRRRLRKGYIDMLDMIVRYLHESLIPFRLASYPSMEHLPKTAHHVPHHAILVESQVLRVADKLVIACYPADERIDTTALATELSAPVVEALPDDLPAMLQGTYGPPPPLGQLFGMPVVIDESVTRSASIVFQPFGESDFFELPYDDFARQEQPRVASFVRRGELPAAQRREEMGAGR